MAKGGRFPLLYWTSIALLALMLVFTGWYFYQNRNEVCRNSISDPLTRAELQRNWQQGRVIVLLAGEEGLEQVTAGMQSLLSSNYKLYAPVTGLASELGKPQVLSWLKDCDTGMLERVAALEPGNQVLLLETDCMHTLVGEENEAGLVLFLLKPEIAGNPGVLACAGIGDWSQ